ncbi:B3 domain-containing protein At5g26805-like [Coffea eugenioides]|uniref:B3 domain-containing protein At5g26805-like n=1 Tax=Coffea eugenioides TaxID=49369 RepID=UPI000F6149A2|nr:B3 domain-containing protein At5g26805-like [Coffea eugenioides]
MTGKDVYYHFLETKEREDESNRHHNLDFRLYEFEVVEKNDRSPQLLYLFPWEIIKEITPQDLELQFGIELNAMQVREHLLTHWNFEDKQRILRGEQVPLLMLDIDTQTEYPLFFKKWSDRERYMIHGYALLEFVANRNLTVGMTIGMYWHNKSRILRLSILDN